MGPKISPHLIYLQKNYYLQVFYISFVENPFFNFCHYECFILNCDLPFISGHTSCVALVTVTWGLLYDLMFLFVSQSVQLMYFCVVCEGKHLFLKLWSFVCFKKLFFVLSQPVNKTPRNLKGLSKLVLETVCSCKNKLQV